MYTKSKIIFALLLLISIVPLLAQNENAGSTGFDTVKLLYAGRAAAMGGALTGVAENYDALEYNPAAYLRTPHPAVTTTFLDHFVGSAGGSVSVIYPRNRFLAWGASLRYWNSGNIDRTEITSTGELVETGETFGASNFVATVSTARFLSPALDFGINLKYCMESLDDASASAVLMDAGIIHHTVNEKIKVGLSIRNVGFQSGYYSKSKFKEGMPTVFTAGLAMKLTDQISAAMDIGKASAENISAKLGVEYWIYPSLALRTGFRSNGGDYNIGGALGWTGGMTMGLGWKIQNFNLDYALAAYGDLGMQNQLTLRYNFAN